MKFIINPKPFVAPGSTIYDLKAEEHHRLQSSGFIANRLSDAITTESLRAQEAMARTRAMLDVERSHLADAMIFGTSGIVIGREQQPAEFVFNFSPQEYRAVDSRHMSRRARRERIRETILQMVRRDLDQQLNRYFRAERGEDQSTLQAIEAARIEMDRIVHHRTWVDDFELTIQEEDDNAIHNRTPTNNRS